ncbi:MAG: SurA N-terminal domain-containing protein [Acidobacteriota bacterium]
MLKLMRDNLKSLSWVLALVVAAFVFAVFADYGGHNAWLGSTSAWAARVNGQPIPVQDLYTAARNLDNYYRNLLGESYDSRKLNLKLGQQAVNQLVQEQLILDHAHSLGLKATPGEIAREIVRDPSLQRDKAFIGVDQYKTILKLNGLDPAVYEESVGRRIVRQKWAELLTAGVHVSDRRVEQEVRKRDETADLVYAQFRKQDLADKVEINQEELASFYEKNKDRYRRGEGRIFDLVFFDRLQARDQVQVTEEQLQAEYDASLQTRFTIPEERRASHILLKLPPGATEEERRVIRRRAEEVLQRVQAGEDFASLAKDLSEDTSAPNGGDLGFFKKGVMTLPFEQAVWQLKEPGEVSGLIQSEFGYHIIQLTGIHPARLKAFEEVRDELENEVVFRESGKVVQEQAESFVEAVREAPDTFRDEAARRTLVASRTPVVSPGDPIPGLGVHPDLERSLFELGEGAVSPALAIPRGYVVARFVEARPGGVPPLEDIADRVRDDLKNEKVEAQVHELARQAADPAQGDLKERGKEMGFEVEEVAQATRGLSIGTLGIQPVLEKAVFSAEIGRINGPLDLPDGPVLFQVTSRKELTPEEIAQRSLAVRDELLAGQRQLLLASITRQLSQAANVEYNLDLIQQIDGTNTPASAGPAATPQ